MGTLGRLNTVVPCSLLNIVDQLSNRRFLVDTRASYSISHTILLLLLLGQSLERQQVNPSHAGVKRLSPYPSMGGSSRGCFAGALSVLIIGVDSLRNFKCSSESFKMVSTLTAAGSADTGSPPVAQSTVTGPRSPVHDHRSLVTGLQRPAAAAAAMAVLAVVNVAKVLARQMSSSGTPQKSSSGRWIV